ncbi:MAG: hypothetical protein DMF56_21405 [Acidobacteria bacterium]|nr:MAG: hypothetical protein DMF56_21405 [Acidobacteriota bacterium]
MVNTACGRLALLAPNGIHFLVDPDHWDPLILEHALAANATTPVNTLIVGGTYIHGTNFDEVMKTCKRTLKCVGTFLTAGPVDTVLSPLADFLVVPLAIGSGNTRFITDHVIAAAATIERYGMPCVRVAYLQLDGGRSTSAAFFTQVLPIPRGKPEIVRTMSLVGRLLGVDAIYLEAGSDAIVSASVEEIRAAVEGGDGLPVLVGGGIKTQQQCASAFAAGARGIVIGSAFEQRGGTAWLATP